MQKLRRFIHDIYQKLNRRHKRWIFRFIDLFLFAISIYLAFSLRFDLFDAWDETENKFLPSKMNVFENAKCDI